MWSPFDTPLLETPLLRSRLGCVVLTLLLLVGINLRLRNLEIPTGRSPDETNYTAQAQRLLNEGGAALRGIAQEYLSDPAARLAGPPTRAGYLWALAGTMRLTGRMDESAGALLSCAASIGSLLLVALIGIRFFPPWATIFALLFFAVSPAEQELARRAWADALVGFLGLAAVYTAAEITHDSTRRFWHVAFIVAGCAGTVVKEFGAVIFALCAAWVLWIVVIQRRQRREGLVLLIATAGGALASLAWLIFSVGGVSDFLNVIAAWREAHVGNQYAQEFQAGSPTLLLRAFYVISPMAALLAVAGIGMLALRTWKTPLSDAKSTPQPTGWLALFSAVFIAIPMILPNWLNLRYVSVLFGLFYLLAGYGLSALAGLGLRRLRGVPRGAAVSALVAIVIIAAANDARRFRRIFVNDGVGDLSVKLILDRADMFEAERVVRRTPTAEHYLELCRRYEQNWRYRDSIAACRSALNLRADYAEAYDQLAVAHVNLEQWPEAAAAAQRALELNPDLARARANLARADQQAQQR